MTTKNLALYHNVNLLNCIIITDLKLPDESKHQYGREMLILIIGQKTHNYIIPEWYNWQLTLTVTETRKHHIDQLAYSWFLQEKDGTITI